MYLLLLRVIAIVLPLLPAPVLILEFILATVDRMRVIIDDCVRCWPMTEQESGE